MTRKPHKISINLYKFHPDRLTRFLVIFMLLLIAATPVSAQSITAHSDVNLNALTTDLDAGEKVSSNNTIDWTSGVDWQVHIKSLDANLGQSDDLVYTKPLADLQWKLSSGGTWTAVTTSDVLVIADIAGGGSGSFDMDYKFLLSWANDRPGTYGATLQYTISAS
jgi:hypothetical protein